MVIRLARTPIWVEAQEIYEFSQPGTHFFMASANSMAMTRDSISALLKLSASQTLQSAPFELLM